jgi:hypothetical protein
MLPTHVRRADKDGRRLRGPPEFSNNPTDAPHLEKRDGKMEVVTNNKVQK